jgi:hypothetical protein
MNSKLGLGGAQFGQQYGVASNGRCIDSNELSKIVTIARNGGIDLIDTAHLYGNSESMLGECNLSGFRVITKLTTNSTNEINLEDLLKKQLDESISRLRGKELYGVLLHNPAQLLSSDGDKLFSIFQKLKQEGFFAKFGVSIYNPSDLKKILDRYCVDIVQSPFSLVDRRLITEGWLSTLNRLGVEVHVRSIFLQGILTMPYENIPEKFNEWRSLWLSWSSWLNSSGISAYAACLQYVLSQPGIDKVIVGVDAPEHLEQLIWSEKNLGLFDYPNISSSDERLIHPFNWTAL